MLMIAGVFGDVATACTQFVSCLVSVINGLVPVIYDTTNSQPTFVGAMLIIAVGMGIVYWVFRLLRGLTAGLAR